jgi:hypothetical protein
MSRFLEEGLASSLLDAARQPLPTCLRILELREYRTVKAAVEDPNVDEEGLPDSPLVDLVFAFRERQMQEGR